MLARSILACLCLSLSGPASAQFAPRSYGSAPVVGQSGGGTWRETDRIRDAIRDGREAGQLSRGEARALRRESRRVDAMNTRYLSGGLSSGEAAELERRAIVLRDAVAAKRSAHPSPSAKR